MDSTDFEFLKTGYTDCIFDTKKLFAQPVFYTMSKWSPGLKSGINAVVKVTHLIANFKVSRRQSLPALIFSGAKPGASI